jgi:uncharacterized integral membrane protein
MAKDDDVEEQGPGRLSRRQDARLILVGVASIALVWFAVGNFGSVRIDFWVQHSRAPLILVILISGLLGALITAVAMTRRGSGRGDR